MLVQRDIQTECKALILEGRPDGYIKQKILEVKKSASAADSLIKKTKKELINSISLKIKSMLEEGKDLMTIKSALIEFPTDLYHDGVSRFLDKQSLQIKAQIYRYVQEKDDNENIIKRYSSDLFPENEIKKWIQNSFDIEIQRINAIKKKNFLFGFFGIIGSILLFLPGLFILQTGTKVRKSSYLFLLSIFLFASSLYKLFMGLTKKIPKRPEFEISENNKCKLYRL
ncbi:hypothetical protein [Flammeovirga pacifica]|uniref:Uncharacterized protein n=1 Tax=Flammeovirga pacifica TaxID=915059 RepID=A0A1S1YTD2_FLAPC|nr:hypothetical protein [Flammeovirga pacifica]OHX64287.1 hypothetical protein NH26_22055 [Flammeovirga pacifica]